MADGRLRACLHWVVQQCIYSVFDTYAASVSSRSGARHAWKQTYMRPPCSSPLGPLLKWISTQKCIQECMVDTSKCCRSDIQMLSWWHIHMLSWWHIHMLSWWHTNVVMVTHPNVITGLHKSSQTAEDIKIDSNPSMKTPITLTWVY